MACEQKLMEAYKRAHADAIESLEMKRLVTTLLLVPLAAGCAKAKPADKTAGKTGEPVAAAKTAEKSAAPRKIPIQPVPQATPKKTGEQAPMLAPAILERLKTLGVQHLDKPRTARIDVPFEKLPPAIGYFLYRLKWPKEVTYAVPEADDPETEMLWMIDFNYEPLELLTKDHEDHFDGTQMMFAIADGGNYSLCFKTGDRSDDPNVEVYGEGEEEPTVLKLSNLLNRLKKETK